MSAERLILTIPVLTALVGLQVRVSRGHCEELQDNLCSFLRVSEEETVTNHSITSFAWTRLALKIRTRVSHQLTEIMIDCDSLLVETYQWEFKEFCKQEPYKSVSLLRHWVKMRGELIWRFGAIVLNALLSVLVDHLERIDGNHHGTNISLEIRRNRARVSSYIDSVLFETPFQILHNQRLMQLFHLTKVFQGF